MIVRHVQPRSSHISVELSGSLDSPPATKIDVKFSREGVEPAGWGGTCAGESELPGQSSRPVAVAAALRTDVRSPLSIGLKRGRQHWI